MNRHQPSSYLLQSGISENYRDAEEHFAHWLRHPSMNESMVQSLRTLPHFQQKRLDHWMTWAHEHHFVSDELWHTWQVLFSQYKMNEPELSDSECEQMTYWSLYQDRVEARLQEFQWLEEAGFTV